jgi:tetratricopeptide (TPR) repeat protein
MVAKDWEGAKADYRAIVDKQPTNALALNNLAWASLQTKDPKALEYAEKAAQLAPNNIAILDTLAMVLAQTGDTKRSIETFQKALKLAPNADGVRLHYAQALANAGQKAEAKKELEAILGSGRNFAGQQAARDLLSKL